MSKVVDMNKMRFGAACSLTPLEMDRYKEKSNCVRHILEDQLRNLLAVELMKKKSETIDTDYTSHSWLGLLALLVIPIVKRKNKYN